MWVGLRCGENCVVFLYFECNEKSIFNDMSYNVML